jgi:hypothetical protein
MTISGLASNPRRSFLRFRDGGVHIFNSTQLALLKVNYSIRGTSEGLEDNYWICIQSKTHDDLQKLPNYHAVPAATDTCRVMDRINSCSPIAHCAQSIPILQ